MARTAASSIDFRQKILRACERRLGSQRRIADVFGVSFGFVEQVLTNTAPRVTWPQSPTRVVRSLAWIGLARLSCSGW